MTSDKGTSAIRHSIAPWLSIPSAAKAVEFNQSHGWRLGRLADPFGLHWEVGHPLKKLSRNLD
jgi:hypothetical protein